jgi:hypothetical protein
MADHAGHRARSVISTVDTESGHVHKTQHSYRDGFKAHVAAEPDTGLITATGLSAGNVGDAVAAPDLLDEEPAGTEVLGDTPSRSARVTSSAANCSSGTSTDPAVTAASLCIAFGVNAARNFDARSVPSTRSHCSSPPTSPSRLLVATENCPLAATESPVTATTRRGQLPMRQGDAWVTDPALWEALSGSHGR